VLHSGQQRIIDEARRFNVLQPDSLRSVNYGIKNQSYSSNLAPRPRGGDENAREIQCPRVRLNGRRFGKTTIGIDLCVNTALDGFPVAWASPTYKMLAEVWREFTTTLRPVLRHVNSSEKRIELITGGIIDCWSLDSADSVRGRKYKRAVVDEAAMVPDLQRAVEEVVRPTLTDYQGDLFLLSTPKGMNYFYQCFQWGLDPQKPAWAAWHMPTVANPFILPAEVEAAREELPALTFRQEYLAEFLQGSGAVFRNITVNLTAPADAQPQDHAAHRVVMGVDWAMKEDFTALSVVCCDCRQELALDRFNQIEWAFQRARLTSLAEVWGVKDIMAEENSIGSPNIEALQRERLPVRPFQTTATSKPPLIQSLALAFERQEARWLPESVAAHELAAYESKVSANTGRISYGAPAGGHDDTVIARALAWYAVMHRGGEFKQTIFRR